MTPRQVVQGKETRISRPEDVKISSDGKYCAVSNNNQDTVIFYPFDPIRTGLPKTRHAISLKILKANHCLPHGIAFSPDGSFVLVTEIGPITIRKDGGVVWDNSIRPDHAKVNIYRIRSAEGS